MRRFLPLALALAFAACTDKPDTDTDIDTDTDSDSDSDTDTDSDSDSDTDTGYAQCTPTVVTTLPFSISGTDFLADFPNDGDYSQGGTNGCTAASGPEVAFEVQLVQGETLAVTGEGIETVIHIKESCETSAACLASVDQLFDGRMNFTAPATGAYTVIIETFNANPVDEYTISMGISEPEICDDDVDNDIDGFVDCDDLASCFGVGDCTDVCLDNAIVATLPYQAAGENFSADFTDDATYADGAGCTFGGGHETVIAVEMTGGEIYRIADLGAADITLRVMGTCIDGDACLGIRIKKLNRDIGSYLKLSPDSQVDALNRATIENTGRRRRKQRSRDFS